MYNHFGFIVVLFLVVNVHIGLHSVYCRSYVPRPVMTTPRFVRAYLPRPVVIGISVKHDDNEDHRVGVEVTFQKILHSDDPDFPRASYVYMLTWREVDEKGRMIGLDQQIVVPPDLFRGVESPYVTVPIRVKENVRFLRLHVTAMRVYPHAINYSYEKNFTTTRGHLTIAYGIINDKPALHVSWLASKPRPWQYRVYCEQVSDDVTPNMHAAMRSPHATRVTFRGLRWDTIYKLCVLPVIHEEDVMLPDHCKDIWQTYHIPRKPREPLPSAPEIMLTHEEANNTLMVTWKRPSIASGVTKYILRHSHDRTTWNRTHFKGNVYKGEVKNVSAGRTYLKLSAVNTIGEGPSSSVVCTVICYKGCGATTALTIVTTNTTLLEESRVTTALPHSIVVAISVLSSVVFGFTVILVIIIYCKCRKRAGTTTIPPDQYNGNGTALYHNGHTSSVGSLSLLIHTSPVDGTLMENDLSNTNVGYVTL